MFDRCQPKDILWSHLVEIFKHDVKKLELLLYYNALFFKPIVKIFESKTDPDLTLGMALAKSLSSWGFGRLSGSFWTKSKLGAGACGDRFAWARFA